MPGFVLLILLLVCGVAVLGACGYLGWRGYRLGKAAFSVGRDIQAAADRLSPGVAALQRKGAALADDQAKLAASLAGLQESLSRLGTVAGLFGEALAPLRRTLSFFRR